MADQKESQKKDDRKVKLIFYVGKDENYFAIIKNKFKEIHPEAHFEFLSFYETYKSKIKTITHKLYLKKPEVVFIDFSCNSESMLRLGMGLKRELTLSKSVIIGLMDNLESRELISMALSLGLSLNIVKSIDISSIVYHVYHLAYGDENKDHGYATAEVAFESKAMSKLKIGYITEKYLHLECDYQWEKGQIIKLKNKIFPEITFPSCFKVIDKGDYALYTQFNSWYNLEYTYLDKEKVDSLSKKIEEKKAELLKKKNDPDIKFDISELEAQLKNLVEEAEKFQKINTDFIKSWILNHEESSYPKRSSILIIDSRMKILYEASGPIDSFKYSIRQQAHLGDDLSLIKRCLSGIIAFEMDPLPPPPPPIATPAAEEKKGENKNLSAKKSSKKAEGEELKEGQPPLTIPIISNDRKKLVELINEVKKIKGYSPILVVFNFKEEKNSFLKEVNYKNIIISDKNLTFEKIEELSNSYISKEGRKKTHDPLLSTADKEKRFYVSKYLPYSITELTHNISVVSISETDAVIKSSDKIPIGTPLYLKYPVKMTMTIVPFPKNSKYRDRPSHFYGLLSGMGEIEKNRLRQHINKLFFTEKDEKKRKEKEEFIKKQKEAEKKIKGK